MLLLKKINDSNHLLLILLLMFQGKIHKLARAQDLLLQLQTTNNQETPLLREAF